MVLDPILDQDALSQQPRTETTCFSSGPLSFCGAAGIFSFLVGV